MINALILAGDKSFDGNPKALIKIGEKFMIEYVINSLRASGCIERIFVVGHEDVGKEVGYLVDGFIESTDKIINNIKRGIEYIEDYSIPCLICTCDIPMVSGEAIRDFVEKCRSQNIDMGYPVIDKKLNDEKYPEIQRTYVRLREGTYTGGNILYVKPQIVDKCSKKAEQLIEYRKKPFMMGKVLGVTFLLRLILSALTINAIEKKIEKMFEIKASAIVTNYPEIGNDVDKPKDIDFVNKYIGKTA